MKKLNQLKKQKMTTTNAVLKEWVNEAERKATETKSYKTATQKAARARQKWHEVEQERKGVNWQFRNACIALQYHYNGVDGFRENTKKLKKLQREWQKATNICCKYLSQMHKYDAVARVIVDNAKKAVSEDPATRKTAREECKRRNRRAKQINRLIASQSFDNDNSRRRCFSFRARDTEGEWKWFALPNRRFYRFLVEKFENKKYLVSRATGNCHEGTLNFFEKTGGKLPKRGSDLAREFKFQNAVTRAASIAIYHHRKHHQNTNNGKGA